MTLLVQFVEYLEKNIYNAYEGTAVGMAQPALKAIKIFFRTNKNTCIDWFHALDILFYLSKTCDIVVHTGKLVI